MPTLRKRGKAYFVDGYTNGKRFRKSVGTVKHIAEAVLMDIKVKMAKGEYLGVYDEPQILFRDYAQEYLGYSQANKSPNSYSRDIMSVSHLLTAFGDKLLTDVTPAQVESYKQLRRQSVEPATVNREVACLKHMFSYAQHLGYLKDHPIKSVKLLKEPPGRLRYLTGEEIDRLLLECNGTLYSIVVMALNTGMRKSEILNLRWEDIDLKNQNIVLPKTKNNELGSIKINEALMRELRILDLKKRSAYVFPNSEGNREGNLRRAFTRALKRAGINDFRFHDLRHTFASHLVMNGIDIRTVQVLMRHKDIKMTLHYAHLSPEHERKAINRLDFGHILGTTERDEGTQPPKPL